MNLPELDYKKIILAILLLIISIVLIVGLVWLIFVRGGNEPVIPGSENGEVTGGGLPDTSSGSGSNLAGSGGSLPVTGSGSGSRVDDLSDETSGQTEVDEVASGSLTRVNTLIDEGVVSVDYVGDSLNYLSADDNRFYQLSLNGEEKYLLSDELFPNVDSVTWSEDGQKVILEYPDGANILYDFTKNKKLTLPTGLEDPDFDSSSESIAYKFIGETSDENWLVVTDIKTNSSTAIEPLGTNANQVQVSWSPNNQVVALYHKATGLDSEEVILVGLNDENFLSIDVAGSNFEGKWSPSGTKMIYSVVDANSGYLPVLWVVDASGDDVGNNNFSLRLNTWVNKCTFGNDNRYVYCAVPTNLQTGAGLYPDFLNDSGDVIYKVDLNTGYSQLLAYPVNDISGFTDYQVGNLFVSDDGSKLYFYDNFSESIYYIRLK